MENLIKTKKEADELLFWIGTLQAEVLPQGYLRLQDSEGGYCCLGVGVVCLLRKPVLDNEMKLWGYNPADNVVGIDNDSWFKHFSIKFRNKYGVSLATMNDKLRLTHKQIGDNILALMHDEIKQAYANG